MAIFKCKMCGGALNVEVGATVLECEFCGTKQTVPRLDSERKASLYDRANHFRRNNEYDKAAGIYEIILNEDKTDAEAYWSALLCRYGVEYVEDPDSKKMIPTVNRTQFTSILNDEDYQTALKYADGYQRDIYKEQAKEIDRIQQGILDISSKEEPFDVFICYKESDSNGRRTVDSVLAQDIYNNLKNEGLKVFFARITLEDKLGIAYEPYIFAALNSAKVMIVVGTKKEHFESVWVKNEWSRYLALINSGKKKTLIPAYKGIDAYDLPQEFLHLQAQDMNKIGFMQDLIHGVKKLVKKTEKVVATETVVVEKNDNVVSLLRRTYLFLEDKDFASADKYVEKILDINPEYAEAYFIKVLVELGVTNVEELVDNARDELSSNANYQRALRFADEKFKAKLVEYNKRIVDRLEESIYETAKDLFVKERYMQAKELFVKIENHKDSRQYIEKCIDGVEFLRKQNVYNSNIQSALNSNNVNTINLCIKSLKTLGDFLDTPKKIEELENKVERLCKANKRKKKIILISTAILTAIVIVISILTPTVFVPIRVNNLLEKGEYGKAVRVGKLTEIVIPYGETQIKNYEFEDCDSLIKVVIPYSVTSVGKYAFRNCESLKIIYCEAESTPVGWSNGWLLQCPATVVWGYKYLEVDGVMYGIKNYAATVVRQYNKDITLTNIPSSIMYNGINYNVTTIAISAFSYCGSLTNVTIADSVISIGDAAFTYCSSLTSVSIGNNVTNIGKSAFSYCTSLESIIIPNSVTSFGSYALNGCDSLKTIYCEAERKPDGWNNNWKNGCSADVVWGYKG